jgi:hypothetical protein
MAEVAEPIRRVVVRWQCPFCPRSRSSKKAITEHIGRCWLNPANKGCKTCANYEPYDRGCGEYSGCCDSPEQCLADVVFPESGLLIRCDKWEPSHG